MSRGQQSQEAANRWVWTERAERRGVRQPPHGAAHPGSLHTLAAVSLPVPLPSSKDTDQQLPRTTLLAHFKAFRTTDLPERSGTRPAAGAVLCEAGDEGSHHLGSFIHGPDTGLGFAGLLGEISTQHRAVGSSPTHPRRGCRRCQVLSAGTTQQLTSREARRSSGQPVFPSSRRGLCSWKVLL